MPTVTIRPKSVTQIELLGPYPFRVIGTDYPLYYQDYSSNYVDHLKSWTVANQYTKTLLCEFYDDAFSSIPGGRDIYSITTRTYCRGGNATVKMYVGVGTYDGSTFTQKSNLSSDHFILNAPNFTQISKGLSLTESLTTNDIRSSNFRSAFHFTNGGSITGISVLIDYFWLDIEFEDGPPNNYAEALYMSPT